MILETVKSPAGIYLDHNATTPLAACVADNVSQWISLWGNASSIHQHGRGPKKIIREVRRSIAEKLNCQALEIIFTSGGSESNNMVLKGIALNPSRDKSRNQIIISAVEHPAVTQAAYSLKSFGFEILEIPVNQDGCLDMEFYKSVLSEKTLLVSVMAVNNETGHIFPISELTALAHQVGALVHTDAVQALGKIPIDLISWGVDFASFSAHKFYALKGSGLLYQKKGCSLFPAIHGGSQERKRRAGTENILAIASFGEVINLLDNSEKYNTRVRQLRDKMEADIKRLIPGTVVTGASGLRVGSCSSLIIPKIDGETLLMNLDLKGFSVSTGAACSAGNPQPSPTLLAMGLSRSEAQASLRLSLGWGTTEQEVNQFTETLKPVVDRLTRLRSESASV